MFVGKDLTPAVVNEVQIDSPAYVAGIQKNDKISLKKLIFIFFFYRFFLIFIVFFSKNIGVKFNNRVNFIPIRCRSFYSIRCRTFYQI